MHRLIPHRKQLLIVGTFLAVLILGLSLFAETAGGVTLTHARDTADHQSVANGRSLPAGSVLSLNNAGSNATVAAAHYGDSNGSTGTGTNNVSTNPDPSQPVNGPEQGSSDPSGGDTPPTTTPPANNPPVVTTPTPPVHCPQCPVREGGTMIACPDYCLSPTPTPGCRPCGGLPKAQTSDAIMCPMYCME